MGAIGSDPPPASKVEVSTAGTGPQEMTEAELEKLARARATENGGTREKMAEHSTIEEVVR
jgi:hypothetical protein